VVPGKGSETAEFLSENQDIAIAAVICAVAYCEFSSKVTRDASFGKSASYVSATFQPPENLTREPSAFSSAYQNRTGKVFVFDHLMHRMTVISEARQRFDIAK